MLGWTILFAIATAVSAMFMEFQPETVYWTARFAEFLFGSLVLLSLFCTIAGKAIRNSLR